MCLLLHLYFLKLFLVHFFRPSWLHSLGNWDISVSQAECCKMSVYYIWKGKINFSFSYLFCSLPLSNTDKKQSLISINSILKINLEFLKKKQLSFLIFLTLNFPEHFIVGSFLSQPSDQKRAAAFYCLPLHSKATCLLLKSLPDTHLWGLDKTDLIIGLQSIFIYCHHSIFNSVSSYPLTKK